MFRRLTALAFVTMLLVSPLKAVAAENHGSTTTSASSGDATSSADAARLIALARDEQRPRALTILYGSFATLQVMDIVSTRKAIGSGAAEVNPMMGSGQTGRMIAMKAVGSAASIYIAEKMWKKNRVGAIVTMVVANSITATVVAHNAQMKR